MDSQSQPPSPQRPEMSKTGGLSRTVSFAADVVLDRRVQTAAPRGRRPAFDEDAPGRLATPDSRPPRSGARTPDSRTPDSRASSRSSRAPLETVTNAW